jgi:hypothetical protein
MPGGCCNSGTAAPGAAAVCRGGKHKRLPLTPSATCRKSAVPEVLAAYSFAQLTGHGHEELAHPGSQHVYPATLDASIAESRRCRVACRRMSRRRLVRRAGVSALMFVVVSVLAHWMIPSFWAWSVASSAQDDALWQAMQASGEVSNEAALKEELWMKGQELTLSLSAHFAETVTNHSNSVGNLAETLTCDTHCGGHNQ